MGAYGKGKSATSNDAASWSGKGKGTKQAGKGYGSQIKKDYVKKVEWACRLGKWFLRPYVDAQGSALSSAGVDESRVDVADDGASRTECALKHDIRVLLASGHCPVQRRQHGPQRHGGAGLITKANETVSDG
eukprot:991457-Amphidinium_carterae.2